MDERQGELHPHPVTADEVVPLTDDDVDGVVVVKIDETELPVGVVLPVRDADGPRNEAELAEILHQLSVADAVFEPAYEHGLGLVAELDAGPRQLHPDPLALDEVFRHVHYLSDDAIPKV